MSEVVNKDDLAIKDVDISTEVSDAYLTYAMNVIVARAVPDIRDGLKPVQRRILASMKSNDFDYNKPYKKSARIVGDVMAQYHPHGDSAIYDAMVRMACDFIMSATLIDGQGNFGSIDNDPAAAMRYTEARLSKLASMYLLRDIKKDTVKFIPNYDKSTTEPTVLPSVFPNILVNGNSGIAVGMSCSIPPHNLHEVIRACCAVIDNPNISLEEIMEIIPGPDFPTGGIVLNGLGLRDIYYRGSGSVRIVAKYEIEYHDAGAVIYITEIPYQANKASIVAHIAQLAKNKEVDGISRVFDSSDKHGICITIEVKERYNPDALIGFLLKHTALSTSLHVNMLVIDHDRPRLTPLISMLETFIEFRCQTIRNRSLFDINKYAERAKQLVGLSLISRDIDRIIEKIKSSNNYEEAQEYLMSVEWDISQINHVNLLVPDLEEQKHYYLSEKQAKGILDLRLHKLTKLEVASMLDELDEIMPTIVALTEIVNNRDALLSVVRSEMMAIIDDIPAERRTKIINENMSQYIKDDLAVVENRDVIITLTKNGYIKSIPVDEYRIQNRGGKGRTHGNNDSNSDSIDSMMVCNSLDRAICISSHGIAYGIDVFRIPIVKSSSKAKGVVINAILGVRNQGEKIVNCIVIPREQAKDDNRRIVFITSDGYIRSNKITDFYNIQSSGKIAIKLGEQQRLVSCIICEEDDQVIITSQNGKYVRFMINAVRVFASRTSQGVRAIKLADGDKIVSGHICKSNDGYLVTFTDDGLAKMTDLSEFSTTSRGCMGSKAHNLKRSDSQDAKLVTSCILDKGDLDYDVAIITNIHRVLRCVANSINIVGRVSKGVKIITLDNNENVIGANIIRNIMRNQIDEE